MEKSANLASFQKYTRKSNLSDKVQSIIGEVVHKVFSLSSSGELGLRLAALFDLFVSCQYYSSLANKGWTYCNNGTPLMLYPYTNACPRCLGKKQFVYASANKPESGQIGVATTEILCKILDETLKCQGNKVEIHKASEPLDVLIYEPVEEIIILAEIKASPLITIPLAVSCDEMREEIEGVLVPSAHTTCDNPFIRNSRIDLYFPKTATLKEKRFNLDIEWTDPEPFFMALKKLLRSDSSFLPFYLRFWESAFHDYSHKNKDSSIFWLTNACGVPSPKPISWPKRRTGGYETVSDAKTSVGMDRTDDIKKGIYQVLKLGAEFKPVYRNVKTALLSNIHAVRHQDEYLKCIKDIIWTIDHTRKVESWRDIPAGTPLYNLFDGIVSFTGSDIRDKVLKKIFSF